MHDSYQQMNMCSSSSSSPIDTFLNSQFESYISICISNAIIPGINHNILNAWQCISRHFLLVGHCQSLKGAEQSNHEEIFYLILCLIKPRIGFLFILNACMSDSVQVNQQRRRLNTKMQCKNPGQIPSPNHNVTWPNPRSQQYFVVMIVHHKLTQNVIIEDSLDSSLKLYIHIKESHMFRCGIGVLHVECRALALGEVMLHQ